MAQLTVGLDIGSETVKRVRLRSSFRTVEVVDFTRLPLPVDDRPRVERVAEVLERLKEDSSASDLVATALPGDEVSLRLLTLPFKDAKRITQTIGFELEGQIPFPIDQVVYDYIQAGVTDTGGSRQLVAMCQIERMTEWIEMFQAAGLDPRLVGSESLAYTSLLNLLPPAEDDATVAVVDVGHRLTSLCIVGPDGVEFARSLTGGGFEVTAQLAEAFRVDLTRAEDGKRQGGFIESEQRTAESPEQVKISDTIKRATVSLVRELRQSLTAHQSLVRKPVTKIWLCGGGATVHNFEGYLGDELGIEVERIRGDHFDLPGMDELSQPGDDADTWSKALGLALHAHQGGRQGWLNLRKGPFAFKGDFQYLRGKIMRVAAAFMILIFLAIGYAVTRYLSLSSANEALDRRTEKIIKVVGGINTDDPEQAIAILKERLSPEADPLPRVTALDVIREIHDRLPNETQLRLKFLEITPKKIRLTGFTDSFESVETIKAAFEKYECFKNIQTGETRKTKDGNEVEFPFTIAFGC